VSQSHSYTRRKQFSGSQLKTRIEPDPVRPKTGLFAGVAGFFANFSTMKSVWQERRTLKNLSDDQLRDIGISWEAAESESSRSFADIPEERKQSTLMRLHSKIDREF